MFYVLLGLFAVMGLIQLVKPQLPWRMNRPLQRPFVKDYEATEPTATGYTMMRITGALFLAMVAFMAIIQAT
ncbi:DUF6199 family natural product biosynthesis protein [Streptomyces sp. NPDC046939]|uniref:DUF6199 family natural product biosynthesis protein n=1 Tax=Streptomyces sp. NPDC046939 TaxID=3155376 RepID=UPI0033CCD253